MYQHILIATDGSDFSQKCVDHGLALAKLQGSKVTIVTATIPYSLSGLAGGWSDSPLDSDAYDKSLNERAGLILAAAETKANEAGVTVSTAHASEVSPATAIIDTADRLNCDLIVMASHGRRGIERMLLGSQTNEVLQMSKVPVLVVR
ncbi:universal stress protein [Paraburkholderia aspalathi]|nr:universal stress protein [Paraburkholderia aspalathi]